MLPRWHILFGFIFSLIVYSIFSLDIVGFIILFISTWIFDIDHYLWFIFKEKNFSLIAAYKYFLERRKKLKKLLKKQKLQLMLNQNKIMIFHCVEVIVIFLLLSLFILKRFNLNIIYAYLFLLGLAFHMALDILEGNIFKERYSLILFLISKKRVK